MKHRVIGALMVCACASACTTATVGQVSWGKRDVSYEQFRRDAAECGLKGYLTDVSDTEAAHVFRRATSQLENNEAGIHLQSPWMAWQTVNTSTRIVAGTRPEKRMGDVREILYGNMDQCLVARGYKPFRLTGAQQHRLDDLRRGSSERHAYLYELGTNPDVLASQAMDWPIRPRAAAKTDAADETAD